MNFEEPLIPVTLVKRYKRFLADVIWPNGQEMTVHCPNPGSMMGLSEPGMTAYLSDSKNPKRKLRYTLEAVEVGHDLVLVNTSKPNSIVQEALKNKDIPELSAYSEILPEVSYGEEKSRIDFLLKEKSKAAWLEIKGVTLAEAGIGYFPDSVTTRGTKHLRELSRIARAGKDKAVLLYLVCRGDVKLVRPAAQIDPAYAKALRAAKRAGVEILAYKIDFDQESVSVGESCPVQLYSKDLGPLKS